jgi:hypothetical protein
MNPDPSHAWHALRTHAGAQLPADFADRVLRAVRLQASATRSANSQLLTAACTGAACLLLVVLVHTHNTNNANQAVLPDWQQLSVQTDSIADVP